MKTVFIGLLFLVCSCCLAQESTPVLQKEIDKIEQVENDTTVKKNKPAFVDALSKYAIRRDTGFLKTVVGLEEEKDPNIDLLISDYIENKKFIGYRIQVFSSKERWEAVKSRSEFLKKYIEEKSYLIYQAPNFKVRIGDYQDRLTAHEHLELIKEDYPTAFIIKDEIELKVK